MKRLIIIILFFAAGLLLFTFLKDKTWLTKGNYSEYLVIEASQRLYSSVGTNIPGSLVYPNDRYQTTVTVESSSSDFEFHDAGVMVEVCYITGNTIGDSERKCDHIYVEINEFGEGSTKQAGRSYLFYHRIDTIRVLTANGYVKPIEP